MGVTSNATRSRKGILACIHEIGPDRIRLVFDDVHSDSETYPQTWQSGVFITWNDYDAREFRSVALSDDQFREIGEALVAFLVHREGLRPFTRS